MAVNRTAPRVFPLDPRLKSKWWRMNNLYKIRDKRGNLVTFKPNKVQLMLTVATGGLLRWLILKARQMGVTTFYCIDLLDDALWIPGRTCAILAHERDALTKIFRIVKRAYDNLPEDIKPITRSDTTNQYLFDYAYNGMPLDSEIYVALKLRSTTVRRLHITESAYIKDRQELEAGSKQAVPKDGIISEETTAHGFDEFYDMFTAALDNKSPMDIDWRALFFPWHQDPEYSLPGKLNETSPDEVELKSLVLKEYQKVLTDGQLIWRRWKLKDLAQSKKNKLGLSPLQLFRQEYPSVWLEAFQTGAGNVFSGDRIMATPVFQPIEVWPNDVKIWKKPVPGRDYVMAVDPSGGDADDEGAIEVFDPETFEQLAEWTGLIRPDELAVLAAQVGKHYNEAYIAPENNMLTTVLKLVEIYPNDRIHSKVIMDEKRKRRTKKWGWNTNTATRDLIIDDFVALHQDGELTLKSAKLLSQMRTFVKKDSGKREHAPGKHDDALFAAMIAVYMRKFHKRKSKGRAFSHKPKGT